MIPDKVKEYLKDVLCFDIETCSSDSDGNPINISDFNNYVKRAKCKWIGFYSYKYNKSLSVPVAGNEQLIQDFIDEHKVLVGFNSEEFDLPIIYNNCLVKEDRYYRRIDIMRVMGSDVFKGHKNRASLMGVKLPSNRLKQMAESFNLETKKGDIDYDIFFKDVWTIEEQKEIKEYLDADIMVTKQLFDKLMEYWSPFVDMVSDKFIADWSWLTSSIASLTYKCACHTLGVEPTFGEHKGEKEEMGGRVILPKVDEARGVWYVDVRSLYPHIYAMFNLHAEMPGEMSIEEAHQDNPNEIIFEGNSVFKVKGKYYVTEQHILGKDLMKKLKMRMKLKKEDPNNPMQYALKILLNSHYGAQRSPIFEQIHTPNGGWDCCWLGQQINELMEKMMNEFGFDVIAGDTDSIFCKAKKDNTEEYIKTCLKKIVKYINENVPFPQETFDIEIEGYLDYIMWSTDLKTGETKKKNYVYLKNNKVSIVGMPIIKDNATVLGKMILNKSIIPMIKETKCAKFDKKELKYIINKYLEREDFLDLMAKEFKVKPLRRYKLSSQIQAQISEKYFNNGDGSIMLIKNKRVGKVGKGKKYCTIAEAKEAKLSIYDIDFEKLYNELQPFCKDAYLDDDKDRKVMEAYLDNKQKNLDEFINSDLFDSAAVGYDIDDKEFIENEIFFELNS